MVKDIETYLGGYKFDVEQSKQDPAVEFITVRDSVDERLEVTIQIIREELYCIYFLNNQFFEISESDLIECLNDILAGKYDIETRKTMRVITSTNSTIPERVEDDSNWKDVYENLPRPFEKETRK